MKRKISLISIWIAIALLTASLFAMVGCKSSQENKKKKESIPLTIEVYDRNAVRTVEYGSVSDNRWTEQIKKRVKQELGIEVQFRAVHRNAEVQELKQQAEEGLDIFFTYDEMEFQTLAQDGVTADLTEELNQKDSRIRDLLGDEILGYGQIDGRQYAVNGKRLTTPLLCSYIRRDWLEELGIELPEKDGHYYMTPSQLKEALLAMKENGYCQYPYGFLADYRCIQPIEGAFVTQASVRSEVEKSQTLGNYLCGMDGDRGAWEFLNQCYLQELISPEFIRKDQDDLQKEIAEEECGFWSYLQWGFMEKGSAFTQIYEKNPEADIQPIEICHEDTTPAYYQKYRPIAAYVMISSSCKQIPEALKYIEWLLSEEAHILLWHGIQGEHWNYDETGAIQPIDSEYNYKSRIDVLDLDMLLLDDPCLSGDHGDAALMQFVEIQKDPCCFKQYIEAGKIATGEGKWEVPYSGRIIESEILYKDVIEKNLEQFTVKCIMAKEDHFDAVYHAALKQLMVEGGQQVLDEKRAAFESTSE